MKAPDHLKQKTRQWFNQVVKEYDLDPHHLRLLILAGEAWDRGQQAREILDREGITYLDRFGAPRARPEAAIERDCRVGFARLIRELALDIDPPEDTRPPRQYGA